MRHKNDLQFERWATWDKRLETMLRSFFAFRYDFIPGFFSVKCIEFIGIQLNQQKNIYTYRKAHAHVWHHTCVCHWIATKFDKIFKFAWASAWHSIRISFQAALILYLRFFFSSLLICIQPNEKKNSLSFSHKFDTQSDLRVYSWLCLCEFALFTFQLKCN